MSSSKLCDSGKIFAKIRPRDVANPIFERYLSHFRLDNTCLERTLKKWDWDLELLSELKKHDPSLQNLALSSIDVFVKSCKRQLQRLRADFQESSDSMINSDGIWVSKRSHSKQTLTDVEEAILCGFIFTRYRRCQKVGKMDIRNLAKNLFPDRNFSLKFAKGFLTRYKSVFSERKKRSMSESRSAPLTKCQAKLFVESFENLLKDFKDLGSPLIPELFCTVDETLLRATSDGKIEAQIIPKGQKSGTKGEDASTIGSMTVFTTANGVVPYVYFCMKKSESQGSYYVPKLRKLIQTRSGLHPDLLGEGHGFSETGLINEEIFRAILENFSKVMKAQFKDLLQTHPLVLYADNLRCHCTVDVLERAECLNIHLNMFSPNSSHFLAPLDNLTFAMFKTSLRNSYSLLDGALSVTNLRHRAPLCSVISEAFMKSFCPSTIRQTYQNVGLWPFRPDIIYSNAAKNTIECSVKKLVKHHSSPLKELVSEMTIRVHEKALHNINQHVDTIEKVLVPKKQQRKNTATSIFEKTGGRFEKQLEYEKQRREEKLDKRKEQEEKKKEREERKRKKDEEASVKREEKRRKVEKTKEGNEKTKRKEDKEKEKEEEKMKTSCHFEGCLYTYSHGGHRSGSWYVCLCGFFFLCYSHQKTPKGKEILNKHCMECFGRGKQK